MKNLNEIFTYVKSSFSALCHPAFIGSSAILSISCDIVVVQLLSCVQLFGTPWTAAHQAFLSLTISQSLLKLMSIESVMPSNHLILCRPLLLLPSIFPVSGSFPELALCIRWPEYWSFSFSISPSNEYSGLISFSNTTVQKHQFFSSQPSLWSNICT